MIGEGRRGERQIHKDHLDPNAGMVHDREVVPEGRRDREPLTHVLAWASVENLTAMLTNYLIRSTFL